MYRFSVRLNFVFRNGPSCVEEECHLNAILNNIVYFKAFLRFRVLKRFESLNSYIVVTPFHFY